jgi:hypothetical protein
MQHQAQVHVDFGEVRLQVEDGLVFADRGIEVPAFLRGLRSDEVLLDLLVRIWLLRHS